MIVYMVKGGGPVDPEGASKVSFVMAILLHINLVVVGIWDLYASFYLPPSNSVSGVIHRWAIEFPPLVLFVGFVLGHLFWPLRIKG